MRISAQWHTILVNRDWGSQLVCITYNFALPFCGNNCTQDLFCSIQVHGVTVVCDNQKLCHSPADHVDVVHEGSLSWVADPYEIYYVFSSNADGVWSGWSQELRYSDHCYFQVAGSLGIGSVKDGWCKISIQVVSTVSFTFPVSLLARQPSGDSNQLLLDVALSLAILR